MINKKAPKDWTFKEAIAELEKTDSRINRGDESKYYSLRYLKELYKRPAPNPFTLDQLATMREFQRDGYNYAAKSSAGVVYVFKNKPTIAVTHVNATMGEKFGRWVDTESAFEVTSCEFLRNSTNWNDPEPLRFADYAPLEENK